jgi:hypothetical protein
MPLLSKSKTNQSQGEACLVTMRVGLELTRRSQVGQFAALSLLHLACTADLPGPEVAEAPGHAFVEVPFAPPPARVETVPSQPSNDDVWIDGEWVWQSGRWAWRSGYWLVPPAETVFSPSKLRRTKLGTLLLARGTWWDSSGREIESIRSSTSAHPQEGSVVTPHGQLEKAAPNIESGK